MVFSIFVWFLNAIYNNSSSLVIKKYSLLFSVFAFYFYTWITAFWHPDLAIFFRYQFYLLCGIYLIVYIYQKVDNEEQLKSLFKIIGLILTINLAIGISESLGLLRLPNSPYSSFVHYFGHSGVDLSDLNDTTIKVIGEKPTGFNWNPNNFGFVILLMLPYFLFHHSNKVKVCGVLAVLWILLSIGSRAHFLAFISLLVFLPLMYKLSKKQMYAISFTIISLLVFILLPIFIKFDDSSTIARMYSVFEQLSVGLEYLKSGSIGSGSLNSTGKRAEVYIFGIFELQKSGGLGVGLGGIEALLVDSGSKITSFHFFFLQMLVDFGWMFIFFIFMYLTLIFKLRKLAINTRDNFVSYISKASALSLLIAIPASLAPSGVHYILSYYILIGFSLAILKIHAK